MPVDTSSSIDIIRTVASLTAKDLTRSAGWFHALSDETRLKILERLSEGEQCVCDLTDMLDTAQSRLSFHLKTLKDAGLLTDRREGRWIYYALNPDVIEEIDGFAPDVESRDVADPEPTLKIIEVLRVIFFYFDASRFLD